MSNWEFKRGDTFSLTGRAGARAGGWTGWTLKAQVRVLRAGVPAELIAELVTSWLDEANGVLLLQGFSTAAWPLGDACADVRLTSPGGEKTTPQGYIRFRIVDPATQDAPP